MSHRDDAVPGAGTTAGVGDPWLVVGLGNPGPSYAGSRHNVGYLVVEVLAERLGVSWKRHRTGRADAAEGHLGTPGTAAGVRRVLLMRPRSYMNESGGPVSAVAAYASVRPERIVAVHDELDLPYGSLRVKLGGGDNGHNGLKSMRRSLGTGDFHRVRVGIGRPPGRQPAADFVLAGWSGTERRELDLHVQWAADAVESLLTQGLERTQTAYNQ